MKICSKKYCIGMFMIQKVKQRFLKYSIYGFYTYQKGPDPTRSGSATLTVGIEPEPHSNFYPEPKTHKNDAAPPF
jgi:hypothetical protein